MRQQRKLNHVKSAIKPALSMVFVVMTLSMGKADEKDWTSKMRHGGASKNLTFNSFDIFSARSPSGAAALVGFLKKTKPGHSHKMRYCAETGQRLDAAYTASSKSCD